jgi:hypothetical protein
MSIQNRLQTRVILKKKEGKVARIVVYVGQRKLGIIPFSAVILLKSFGSVPMNP